MKCSGEHEQNIYIIAVNTILYNITGYGDCKLQGAVSRTSLQIDMKNFVGIRSGLQATKKEMKKVIFKKTEIQAFIISAMTFYFVYFTECNAIFSR